MLDVFIDLSSLVLTIFTVHRDILTFKNAYDNRLLNYCKKYSTRMYILTVICVVGKRQLGAENIFSFRVRVAVE